MADVGKPGRLAFGHCRGAPPPRCHCLRLKPGRPPTAVPPPARGHRRRGTRHPSFSPSSSFSSSSPLSKLVRDDARWGGSVALPWHRRRRGQRRQQRQGRRTRRISIAAGVIVASTGGGDGGIHHCPCRRDEDARVVVNVDGAAVPIAVSSSTLSSSCKTGEKSCQRHFEHQTYVA